MENNCELNDSRVTFEVHNLWLETKELKTGDNQIIFNVVQSFVIFIYNINEWLRANGLFYFK